MAELLEFKVWADGYATDAEGNLLDPNGNIVEPEDDNEPEGDEKK